MVINCPYDGDAVCAIHVGPCSGCPGPQPESKKDAAYLRRLYVDFKSFPAHSNWPAYREQRMAQDRVEKKRAMRKAKKMDFETACTLILTGSE